MRNKTKFFLVIFIAALLRFFLSFSPGFRVDVSAWYAWADRLINLGFNKFYDPKIWTHYTPGYLYVLWLLGQIKKIFNLSSQNILLQLFKFPANLADILTAILIYKITLKKSLRWAWLGLIFYLFNPALIFNSSVWGQIDSLLSLLILISFYLLLERRKPVFSSLTLAFAFLIKPQALFILPIMIIILIKNYKLKEVVKFGSLFISISLFLSWPFFPHNPVFGLPQLIGQMSQDYSVTTAGAFNFWRLFGNWQNDADFFWGLSKYHWGLLIYIFSQTIILIPFCLKRRLKKNYYYLTAGLSLFSFFLFPTRIHERYLLPVFPFLLTAGISLKSLFLITNFVMLAILHFLNLFYIYHSYYPDFAKIPILGKINNLTLQPLVISLITLASFVSLLIFYLRKIEIGEIRKVVQRTIGLWPKKVKKKTIYLILILTAAFLVRFWRLWYPQAYIFDEVYHGFTAQEMAKDNIQAWEWWNTPPEGFAYEWTHPHLAKEIMALSTLIFGQSQFSFRLPAVFFGVATVYLTYLIAKQIFKKENVALMAAFFVCFDGLNLTMSRVGMTDIYFLFFLLLTIYLSLKEKCFYSGISLGLSLATKWTGLYLYPVIGVILFLKFTSEMKKIHPLKGVIKLVPLLTTYYLLTPFLIYLLSYLPFFTYGHTWNQFIELQKQMWWYHTNLEATHNYQSPAISWPLMLKPVWFWVRYEKNKIANIYNLGNPWLWWTGVLILPSVIWQVIKELKQKSFKLSFILFCYFAFWLPWLFSPRIMFLHHYLPALPFLFILIAWTLNRIQHLEFRIWNWKIKGSLLTTYYLLLTIAIFFFFYPLNTGILLPTTLLKFWFWLPFWR